MCLLEHLWLLFVELLVGGMCLYLFIPLWAGRFPRQVNFGNHTDWQFILTSPLAFKSIIEGLNGTLSGYGG